MNVKRFTARTSREAFALVRQAFGEDAVVLSTKPAPEGGVEVLAMAPDTVAQLEKVTGGAAASPSPVASAAKGGNRPRTASSLTARLERQPAERPAPGRGLADRLPVPPAHGNEVDQDVEQLAMSTLSFQDYVRERMLRRRQAADGGSTAAGAPPLPAAPLAAESVAPPVAPRMRPLPVAEPEPERPAPQLFRGATVQPVRRSPARRLDDGPAPDLPVPTLSDTVSRHDLEVLGEIRAMKGMIEERFGMLAFMERLGRDPRQALLAQKLMELSFSPGLVRKLVEALPAHAADELAWAAMVLERNLATAEQEPALEDRGGVFALIGSTGVGKTTTTAKLAAAAASAHGPGQLGLITLDAYRVGAHEQLRAYGRILGVPVHTAHDRASLEDLLELLSNKKMVLIDTAGMAQRDSRTKELLSMLSHPSIQRLLVLDASVQGETLDEVIAAWRAPLCKGVILSKIDQAVKLAPALDALIRHRLKVVGVANGQRVPEDWHRLTSNALLHRALRGGGGPTWKIEPADVQLVFSASPRHPVVTPPRPAAPVAARPAASALRT